MSQKRYFKGQKYATKMCHILRMCHKNVPRFECDCVQINDTIPHKCAKKGAKTGFFDLFLPLVPMIGYERTQYVVVYFA